MDPSPGLPRPVPTELPESLPTLLPLPSPPQMSQAWETGGLDSSGEALPLPLPASLQERPHHVAAHKPHRDLGLWPGLLLTQRLPIIWGKREGDLLSGLTVGLRREQQPHGGQDSAQKGPEGPPRPHPGPHPQPCWTSAGVSLSLTLSVQGLTEFRSDTSLSRSVK